MQETKSTDPNQANLPTCLTLSSFTIRFDRERWLLPVLWCHYPTDSRYCAATLPTGRTHPGTYGSSMSCQCITQMTIRSIMMLPVGSSLFTVAGPVMGHPLQYNQDLRSAVRCDQFSSVLCLPSVLWLPSVLCRCWLGGRKGIRPVKKLE